MILRIAMALVVAVAVIAKSAEDGEVSAAGATHKADTRNPVVRLEITSLHESSNRQARSSGTGFFVTHNGYVLTNDHVVRPIVEKERCKTQSIKVRVNQGQRDERVVTGKIFAFDPVADLAVIKISGTNNWPVLPLNAPHALQPGIPVCAQGYPLGGPYKETNGVVIADLPASTERPTGVILTSAPVQPGNSGGPILDGQGNVIGVAVAMSNVELLKSIKDVQDAAKDAMTQMMAALAEASEKMKAQGDKDGYGARMDTMVKKGKVALDKYAEQSWVLAEAVKYPNKTHAIAIADVNRLLDKWRVKRVR
jgi:V8-like Glu-specific endopeptidase